MLSKRFFSIPLLWTCICFAQQPALPGCVIEGRVVRAADRSGLKGARIELQGVDEQNSIYRAVTVADGRFRFSKIPAGRYRLKADHFGYAPQSYRSLLLLKPGEKISDVLFPLQADGVVIGKVVSDDGEPLPGIEVRAAVLSNAGAKGRKNEDSGFIRIAVTNDLGEYRLYGLPPGQYYVMAVDTGNPYLTEYDIRSGMADTGNSKKYPPIYYPGTPLRHEATPVGVHAGDELRIDFKLQRIRGSDISGHITLRDGQPGNGAAVVLERQDPENLSASEAVTSSTDSNGAFVLSRVPPGEYVLRSSITIGDKTYAAKQTIDVAGDADGVIQNLVLAPPHRLRGRVLASGGSSVARDTSMMVWVYALDGDETEFGAAEVQADGTFTILPGLTEGRYSVSVTGLPQDSYLQAAFFGSQDALQEGITISNRFATAPLDLIVSPSGAQVSGVLQENGAACSGANLKLISQGTSDVSRSLATAITDEEGHFNFSGLPPGDYEIFEAGDDSQEDSAEPLAAISLNEGDRRDLQLNLTKAASR